MAALSQPTIRKAHRDDLPAILELVRELAHYERAPDEVTATPQMYEDGFEADFFDAIVAEIDSKIVGLALYYKAFSTWKGPMLYLEDFVITRSHRRKGLGTLIFERFLDEARGKKVSLAKWQVLDWNEPAIRFYKKYQSQFDEGWVNVKLSF